MSLNNQNATSRRTVVKGAAWSVPVIAAAIATPAMAASGTAFALVSNFGSGWYPDVQSQTDHGVLQYDSKTSMGKYLTVTGTQAGDVVSGISMKVLIGPGWPVETFTPLAGSNLSWSTLTATGTTELIGGVPYNVYTSTYTGSVTATGASTVIPIDFFFRSNDTAFYDAVLYQTTRYATVTSGGVATPLTYTGPLNDLVNTNKLVSERPTP